MKENCLFSGNQQMLKHYTKKTNVLSAKIIGLLAWLPLYVNT